MFAGHQAAGLDALPMDVAKTSQLQHDTYPEATPSLANPSIS